MAAETAIGAHQQRGRVLWKLSRWSVVLVLFPLAAKWFWLSEVTCHFRPELALILSALGLAALLLRHPKQALALTLLAACSGWRTARLYLPTEHPPAVGSPLRVASANLLWGEDSMGGLTRWLQADQPDLVFLAEVDLERLRTIETLGNLGYEHQLIWPPTNKWTRATWGRALISRRPFVRARVAGPQSRIMDVSLEHERRELRILGAHPMRPGRSHRIRMGDETLSALGQLAAESANVIVIGDLNLTENTPRHWNLLEQASLTDSRMGRGRMGTWTVRVPIIGLTFPFLRMPLDHVLLGEDLTATERWLGSNIGSDHLPIAADICWTE